MASQAMDAGPGLHVRHESLLEWASSPVRQLLVTAKIKCHCCTFGDIEPCWLLLWFVGSKQSKTIDFFSPLVADVTPSS